MAWAHHGNQLLWQPKDVHALVLAIAVLTLNIHALARSAVVRDVTAKIGFVVI